MKNCLVILLLFVWKCAFSQFNDPVKVNDVVINEVFADPNPQIGLPSVEFIELWNTTGHNISLKNWVYSDAGSSFRFSGDSIKANEYLIVCARIDTARFKAYGRVIGISPWPSLNNTADHLSLKSPNGIVVSEVIYSDSWYQADQKKAGGWTLELIDPKAICTGIQNWWASNDPSGGTPGRKNSVYKFFDSTGPLKLTRVLLLDSVSLALSFNRYTDSLTATDPGNYFLNNGVGKPSSVSYSSSNLLTIVLKFSATLTRGNIYKVTVDRIADCSGSVISEALNFAEFLLPKKIIPGDILISEILFNPRESGVDFVEIYNNSGHVLDLQELSIGNLPLPDTLNRAKRLSINQLLLKPEEYLVLTADPEKVKTEYHIEKPEAFLRVSSFPAYNNDKGTVTLLSQNKTIDEFSYTEKMHSSLIKNPDGISLERSDFKTPGNEPGNFRSSAASSGFATPGYKNSQLLEDARSKDEFNLVSTTFSPDNDGFEDLMQISYHLAKPGFVANITVYNDRGKEVRKLYKNFSLGAVGFLEWDGQNESAEILPAGIYLLYAYLFNTDGEMKKFRKTVVLAKKLN